MIYGLIIAAGNQTRFGSDVPKALSKVGDRTCLDINISNMCKECDEIFIFCSKEKEEYFKGYDNVIAIDSGYGCGDAVYKALRYIDPGYFDTVFIQWGDSINQPEVYYHLRRSYSEGDDNDILVAARWERFPYVKLGINYVNEYYQYINEVSFSKYDGPNENGYHDLSLFYGDALAFLTYCETFVSRYYRGNYYEHPHGNEFNFLDIFNEVETRASIVDMGSLKSYSFNTEEEYNNMIKEIGDGLSEF